MCTKNFTYTNKFYVHVREIAAVDSSKTYLLKNAKKKCKSNNRDLNRDWIKLMIRIHWRLLIILKTSIKSVWSNVFWYVKVSILWKCIQYSMHWGKTQMLQKFHSDKDTVQKNALFFLSRAPTHHSFTFNLWFLHELKRKFLLSKTVCGVSQLRFRLVLIKVYIFVQQNAWTLWL